MRSGQDRPSRGVAFVQIEGRARVPCAGRSQDHPFGTPTFTGRSWPLADTRLLAPILPSKVVAVGRNYADHAAELGNAMPAYPMIFIKPSTSVIGPQRADSAAGLVRAGGLRGRARGGHRPPVPGRQGGERLIGHPRLHGRQ